MMRILIWAQVMMNITVNLGLRDNLILQNINKEEKEGR